MSDALRRSEGQGGKWEGMRSERERADHVGLGGHREDFGFCPK